MKISNLIIISIIFILCSCKEHQSDESSKKSPKELTKETLNKDSRKIPILNFGTFHMGFTSDASTTDFNQHDKENQNSVHEIAKKIVLV